LEETVFFAVPFLGNALSAVMAGFVSLYSTLLDLGEGVMPTRDKVLLIVNLAPPTEASLAVYLELFQVLSSNPIVSTTELSMEGRVCFRSITVGLSDAVDLSKDTTFPHYIDGARRFVARHLGIDLDLVNHFHGEPTLVLAARYGVGNRNFVGQEQIVAAVEKEGFKVIESELQLGHEAMTLLDQFNMLANCSVLMGVTGDALTGALWMTKGSVVIQIVPFGVDGRFGTEYKVLAENGPGHYIQWDLDRYAAGTYPWNPHPTALENAPLYWQQDPRGANLLYMAAGSLRLKEEEVRSYVRRASSMLQTEAPQPTEMVRQRQAILSLSWHSAEGFSQLMPQRGKFS